MFFFAGFVANGFFKIKLRAKAAVSNFLPNLNHQRITSMSSSNQLPRLTTLHRVTQKLARSMGVIALLAGLPAAASAVTGSVSLYTVTDVGASTANRLGNSTALALSQNGTVVGQYTTTSGATHAFVWINNRVTDLGTLGGGNSSAVGVANVDGAIEVVGNSELSGNTATHAFVWSRGTMKDLGVLPALSVSDTNSFATGINSNGNIVGTSETGLLLNSHAFLFTTNGTLGEGNLTDLGVLAGGSNSASVGLGDDNVVVGSSEGANITDGNFIHAFVTGNENALIDLGTLDGLGNSSASAISSNRVIIGESATTGGNIHGFTFNTTTDAFTDIGVTGNYSNSHPLAINSRDEVVGYLSGNVASPNDEHAFFYSNGTITDLNTLALGSGWILRQAYGINDKGQIVGVGTNASGHEQAFLLTVKKPQIIAQPVSVTILRNGNTTLSVQAVGVDATYQWFKNRTSITGATNANLTLSSVTATTQASYYAVVTNSAGATISAAARVTVIATAVLPRAIVLPRVESVRAGGIARFRAIAIGTRPFTYQWQQNGANLVNGGEISGATSAMLTITNVQDANAGNYTVVLTNPAGPGAPSANCVLTVRD
jgi:probable HAF family extracellular repeat protein